MSRVLAIGAFVLMFATGCTPTQLAAFVNAGPANTAPAPVINPHGHNQPSDLGLARIRACESGPPDGNYTIVSSNGLFYGAYQFTRSTWNGVASRWYPELTGTNPTTASRAQQDNMARALWAERGAQPWPICGKCVTNPSGPKCKGPN